MEQPSEEKLFTEFKPVSTTQWEEKIIQDLKEADCFKKLLWKTSEGFDIKPYYRSEDLNHLKYLECAPGEFPFIRGNNTLLNEWEIREDISVEDIKKSNDYLLHILDRGITSPGLKFDLNTISSADKLETILKNVHINFISLNLLSGKDSPELFEFLVQIAKKRQLKPEELKGSFDYDPLGCLTIKGDFYVNENEDFDILAHFLISGIEKLPEYKLINVSGLNFNNAGASIVQELAYSLSEGNEYLSRLNEKGIKVDDIAKRINFTFGIGSNYFMEIAKLRAARFLWSKIVEAYNPGNKESAKMHIHAVTADWNKTLFDPYVNMLRSTTESMSATLGGADSLEVLPFDNVFAKQNEFSSRIARNTQIIIKEEAYFEKVVDPAAGSYYIENLTNSIAEHAWNLFLKIEEMGGFVSAFKKGTIQEMISESASEKLMRIATRKDTLLGTNQYPDLNEKVSGKIDKDIAELNAPVSKPKVAEPLILLRGSMEFDELRQQTESAPKRPKVFMLTIGNIAMRRARAAFSCNFFGCAGYEIIDNSGFSSIEEGLKSAYSIKANIIVLCSSDEEYTVYGPETITLMNNKAILVIAGEPACKPDLEAKGIKHFISLKSNLVEALKQYHKLLGIA